MNVDVQPEKGRQHMQYHRYPLGLYSIRSYLFLKLKLIVEKYFTKYDGVNSYISSS